MYTQKKKLLLQERNDLDVSIVEYGSQSLDSETNNPQEGRRIKQTGNS